MQYVNYMLANRRSVKLIEGLHKERKLRKAIKNAAEDILVSENFDSTKDFIQHGSISVNAHCMNVAKVSLRLNRFLNAKCDEEKLIRGALLHDYFLYDWHIPDEENPHRWHGFHHAKRALLNASNEYELSDIEKDIIVKHMWPLNPVFPKYRESWVVTAADKWCSTMETIHVYKGHGIRRNLRGRFNR